MSENEIPNQSPEEPREPVSHATPLQRVWAWVGVVYMVIITLLFTWFLAHGAFLNGIGPLMLCPALGGLGASAVVSHRTGRGKGGLAACILITAAALLLIAVNLAVGLPALLDQLGG